MPHEEAKRALVRARDQLDRVSEASWEPKDPEGAVTWAFYAYENAVVALAESFGIHLKRTHPAKADLARDLHQKAILSCDVWAACSNG